MAKVSYRDARGVLREFVLEHTTTIGRHPEQILQILDRVMSKNHAIIEREPSGDYSIRDAGSRNGTIVNGVNIEGKYRLQYGDRILLGATELVFEKTLDIPTLKTTNPQLRTDSPSQKTLPPLEGSNRVASTIDDRFLPEEQINDIALLRRDYEKLRSAHELSQSIGIEMDIHVLLGKILDKALDIFPADRAVILLKEAAQTQLIPMVARDRSGGEVNPDDVTISNTILNEVVIEKRAVLSSDAMVDERFSGAHSIMISNIRSTMSVPLLHEDNVVGVIHLDSMVARGAFTEKDLQIMTGFARQAAVMVEHHRLLKQMEEEIVVRENLHRLLSPQLVEEVVSGRLELTKGGELRNATIMFADIRNFTGISESMKPQQLVTLLNDYFELMVDVIFKYQGTLDKFIGDEIMAIWGAPISHEDDAERAVRCAIEMQQILQEFNDTYLAHSPIGLRIGIGINTGEVVAGYMGSTKSMNYTVMGDVVNTASRLCSTAAADEILIGQTTHQQVTQYINAQQLPPTKLKGKAEHVDIFRVQNLRRKTDSGLV